MAALLLVIGVVLGGKGIGGLLNARSSADPVDAFQAAITRC
jgi:hypothetical protein